MILGYLLLAFALAFTVAANVLFTIARRPNGERFLKLAKGLTVAAMAGVIGASVYLASLIATHQFQVAYVFEYSSLRSNKWYLFASFWGGQEGSLLLWTLWTAVMGVILAYRGGERTSKVWPLYGIVQVFLLALLLIKCPFKLGVGAVPLDGRGLNPLLENMWMVIHPPILFLGFASLLAPFAWTVYGLIYRDWDGWAKAAFSWVLFSFATLGFGLSLGGYWAYETLGWGGFWAWDPVENASFLPWLTATAFIHSVIVQERRGMLRVWNLSLVIATFCLTIYGTFLTRTGLLSDFSVHSFSSLGNDGFYILLVGVSLSFLVPTVLLIVRGKEIPKPQAYENLLSREFGYFLACAIFGLMGFITAVGMSAPLITKIWMAKGAAAEAGFYNQATFPLALLMTLGMAVTPYLAWKASETDALRKKLWGPYAGALLLTVGMAALAWYLGVRKPWQLLLFATSVFAVLTNLVLLVPRMKHKSSRRTAGGFIAHVGAGLILMSICGLVAFQRTASRVELYKDMPVEVMGMKLTYLGQTSQPYDRDTNKMRIRIESRGKVWEGRPRYYFAPFNNQDSIFANPPAVFPSVYSLHSPADLRKLLPWNNPFMLGDLYVAFSDGPYTLHDGKDGKPFNPNAGFGLQDGQTVELGDYKFGLVGLDLDDEAKAALASHDPAKMNSLPVVTFKAQVAVDYKGQQAMVEPSFKLEQKTGGRYSTPVSIPGPDGSKVMLNLLPPSEEQFKTADPFKTLAFQTMNAPDPTEHVFVDVSIKPMIGMVWIGSILFTIGGLVAYRRRAYEAGLLGKQASVE